MLPRVALWAGFHLRSVSQPLRCKSHIANRSSPAKLAQLVNEDISGSQSVPHFALQPERTEPVPDGVWSVKPTKPFDTLTQVECRQVAVDDSNGTSSKLDSDDTVVPARSVVPVELPSPVLLTIPDSISGLRHFWQIAEGLSKARLSLLVVSTAVVGCALAAPTSLASAAFLAHPYRTALCLTAGTALTSAAANTINQILEIPFDSQMKRTRTRVLPRGLTTPGRAGLFALGSASIGLTSLYLGVNPLVAGLAATNILLYTGIYTPLKQIDQANTWIGALVGAVPPVMGWVAVTGQIQSGSLMLASLLYVWQFPHFMALSWNLRHEYARTGYMMTSVLEPNVCKQVSLRYAIAATFVCLAGAGCSALTLGPWGGCALGLACLPPNAGLVYYAWRFAKADSESGSSAAARRLFRATLFHLPVVMTALLAGTYFCVTNDVTT